MRVRGKSSKKILQKTLYQNILQAEPRKNQKQNIKKLLKEKAVTRKNPGQKAIKIPKITTLLFLYSEYQIDEKNKRKESGSYLKVQQIIKNRDHTLSRSFKRNIVIALSPKNPSQ